MPAQPSITRPRRSGGYHPVVGEATVPEPTVSGRLPRDLDGSFLRIGPNALSRNALRQAGHAATAGGHLLSGQPMVHGVRIRDGRAEWYRNRWVRTDQVAGTLGGLPTPGPRHGLSDECNGNLLHHAGRTYAVGDGGVLPTELDRDLGTVARSDFDGTLPAGFSAHPEHDPVTGELYAVAYYHELPYAHFLTIGVDGRVRRAEQIAMKQTSMMHAFSLTDRHAVLYDLPVVYHPAAAAAGSRIPYAWDDNHGARLGILPRDGGDADVLWVDIDPCYVFHPVNAYQTAGNRLVIDVVRHERVFDRDRHDLTESLPALWRWVVDLSAGIVAETQLDDHIEEFPRIDERYRGTRHRYAYAVAMRCEDGTGLGSAAARRARAGHSVNPSAGPLAGAALVRHDLDARRTALHEFGPGRETGEAVFVPRGADAPEGDGWLMSMVYDRSTDRSELVVLDTADFTGEPVATVHLPVRVPHGFHAAWIPA